MAFKVCHLCLFCAIYILLHPITHSCNAISHSEISQDVVSCTRMIVPPFYLKVMLQLSLQTGVYCVAGGARFFINPLTLLPARYFVMFCRLLIFFFKNQFVCFVISS